MSPKHTLGDQGSAAKIFVDRVEFQDAFSKALERKPEEKYKVLVYYGVRGIGKTALREELQENLKQSHKDVISVVLDFTTPSLRMQSEGLAIAL
ncbi:MAG: ATP-binding protein [Desulfosporosinus sp.]|nr:ATP-binding protein [Desulfosporosinus sp.]